MPLPPTQLQIIFSANAAKSLRLTNQSTLPTASLHPGHFLQQWRIELIHDPLGRKAYLVTNFETLFTFLIPREPPCTLQSVLDTFLMRLRFSLLASNPPIEWKPSEILPVRGNPRRVIGSMNDMIAMLAYRRDPPAAFANDVEDFLNETPFSMLGMESPNARFIRRLREMSHPIDSQSMPSV